jgi:uncharacterized DUF497 family protein
MKFEWDQRKATLNLGKHGVDFADAVTVYTTNLPSLFPMILRARTVLPR